MRCVVQYFKNIVDDMSKRKKERAFCDSLAVYCSVRRCAELENWSNRKEYLGKHFKLGKYLNNLCQTWSLDGIWF